MAHSPLIGRDEAARYAPGRDTGALGPSDTTDSGSDVADLGEDPGGDPMVPVDVAMRDDQPHGLLAPSTLDAVGSDAAGTGERRSAAGDGGVDGADIGLDRVFVPGGSSDVSDGLDDEDLDPEDLAMSDELDLDLDDDEEVDEDADAGDVDGPVGDGRGRRA